MEGLVVKCGKTTRNYLERFVLEGMRTGTITLLDACFVLCASRGISLLPSKKYARTVLSNLLSHASTLLYWRTESLAEFLGIRDTRKLVGVFMAATYTALCYVENKSINGLDEIISMLKESPGILLDQAPSIFPITYNMEGTILSPNAPFIDYLRAYLSL